MKKNINLEALLRLIIIFGMAIIIFKALITGEIRNYVHPRINIYLWISIFTLIIIGIFMLPSLFKPKHATYIFPYLIILFPIITACIVSNTTVSASSISNGSSTYDSMSSSSYNSTQNQPQYFNSVQAKVNIDAIAPKQQDGMRVIEDKDFAVWYLELNDNMDKYEGETVRFKAQVFRTTAFAKNEFVPSRLTMVCCAADMQPVGFLCRYDNAQEFKNDEWIMVTAKIKIEEYQGEKMPILYPSEITKTEKPKNEYVYFY
jgi:putative membrane protein